MVSLLASDPVVYAEQEETAVTFVIPFLGLARNEFSTVFLFPPLTRRVKGSSPGLPTIPHPTT